MDLKTSKEMVLISEQELEKVIGGNCFWGDPQSDQKFTCAMFAGVVSAATLAALFNLFSPACRFVKRIIKK